MKRILICFLLVTGLSFGQEPVELSLPEAVSHALGYVGEVSTEELETEQFADYGQGSLVGKTGVELQYESLLQGRDGVRYLEVDAVGRIVGSMVGIGVRYTVGNGVGTLCGGVGCDVLAP